MLWLAARATGPAPATLGPIAGAATLAGCALPRPATVPLEVLRDAAPGKPRAVVVMLPGALSLPDEFVREGLVGDLRGRGIAADIAIPDAHPRYYFERSILTRLREDVVLPARARGLPVWLVGISLGGFGALGYAARHGKEIVGVLAIAPYVGRREIQRDLLAAGGPAFWRQQARPEGPDDLEHELWMWLTDPARRARTTRPPLWLGYGRDDRLAPALRGVEPLLPPERVDVVDGGHDWPPWRALWQRWLDRGVLARATAGA